MRSAPAISLILALVAAGCGGGGEESAPERPPAEEVRAPEPAFTMVTDPMLAGVAADSNWLVHGGDYGNRRYSTLNQISTVNVTNLVPVWIHQTGIAESFVTTPIVVDGAMYLTTPESHVVALNAATGARLWEYVPKLATTTLCCGPENQGVAVYGDRVFVATVDNRVIALDHRSGEPVWETSIADPREGYSQTIAPLAAAGKVFVGVGGAEYGTRGFVVALDAESGKVIWRWYTIAGPGESPNNGWQGEWRETDPFGTPLNRDILAEQKELEKRNEGWKRGGGAIRTTPAYDVASGLLYLSIGGPAPSLDGSARPGDNLYAGSLVALEAESGKVRWAFQYIPHDLWDLSGGSAPFILEAEGRKVVGIAGKTGWVYIVDAATGQPVIRSDNFVPQENLFVPPNEEGVRILPGANGGNPGAPVAHSQQTGLLYIPALHQPMLYSRAYQPWEKDRLWLGGSFRHIPDEPQWGILSAVNPLSGEIRWQRQIDVPMSGGALTTAGGLLFVGQGTGTLDAFDANSGELLWQFHTGAGVSGTPVTYQIEGVQYIAVASGGHHQLDTPRGDAVIVFTLFQKRPPRVLSSYRVPSYQRNGAARYGAVRQIPLAEAQRPDESQNDPRE